MDNLRAFNTHRKIIWRLWSWLRWVDHSVQAG